MVAVAPAGTVSRSAKPMARIHSTVAPNLKQPTAGHIRVGEHSTFPGVLPVHGAKALRA